MSVVQASERSDPYSDRKPLESGEPKGGLHLSQRMVSDAFLAIDMALVFAMAMLAKLLYIDLVLHSINDDPKYALAGIFGAIAVCCVFRGYGLDKPALLIKGHFQFRRVVFAVGLSFLAIVALGYVLKISADFSRVWFFGWFAMACVALCASRLVQRAVYLWLVRRRHIARRVAVVGDNSCRPQLMSELESTPDVRIVGVFPNEGSAGKAQIDRLIELGQKGQIDEIYVAVPLTNGQTLQTLERISLLPVNVWLAVDELSSSIRVRDVMRINNLSLFGIRQKPVRDWGSVVKLAEDYILGLFALLLFAPVMALIALAIKLESRGPVLFRQRRHGYNHRVFQVYKFRTMTVMEDGDTVTQASARDMRVTRVGRFLRMTSLDELPQLFNVILGDMSLVGPRPHALVHNFHYQNLMGEYARRHNIKPGITGWAQINGYRGPTEDVGSMYMRVRYDLDYLENWSLWWDLEIILRTVSAVLSRRNAL
jgi:Undecaprenyl-phosphate glucose phosphotransferase